MCTIVLPWWRCSAGCPLQSVFRVISTKLLFSHPIYSKRCVYFPFQPISFLCFRQNNFVVETSLVGTVFNGLSHLDGVTERGQFVVGLLRGLGGNLNLKTRQEFAKEVR